MLNLFLHKKNVKFIYTCLCPQKHFPAKDFRFQIRAATTKKTKISEENLVRENVKSLSNSVTKFCD